KVKDTQMADKKKKVTDRSQLNILNKTHQNKERCDHQQRAQKQNHGTQAIKQIIKYGELELLLAFKVKMSHWNLMLHVQLQHALNDYLLNLLQLRKNKKVFL